MEIIQGPSLLKVVREEVEAAKVTDPATGGATLDSQVGYTVTVSPSARRPFSCRGLLAPIHVRRLIVICVFGGGVSCIEQKRVSMYGCLYDGLHRRSTPGGYRYRRYLPNTKPSHFSPDVTAHISVIASKAINYPPSTYYACTLLLATT